MNNKNNNKQNKPSLGLRYVHNWDCVLCEVREPAAEADCAVS